MSRNGYNGKILKVNLTDRSWKVDEPDDAFYRKYLGGSALGVYYCLTEMPARTDAMAPEAVLVFAPGVLSGAPVTGSSRFTVTARSPLGGAIGDSQCGGSWGPALKHSGYDAIVITGKAPSPVYISINSGAVEIKDASSVWGLETHKTRAALQKELGDDKVKVACIGPAGEKLVRFACVSGGASNYAGRTGMGAVMGSKNLKAIACSGSRPYSFADKKAVAAMSKKGGAAYQKSGFQKLLRDMGTAGVVQPQHDAGSCATRNFSRGSFDAIEGLTGQVMKEKLLHSRETCYACVVGCKKTVAQQAPYNINPELGGPEFETISLLGSNLCIGDLSAVCKANEICNALGMDTITAGAVIATVMESFEEGIITTKDTGGLEPRFGSADALIALLGMIAAREGIGDALADGMAALSAKFKGSEKYAIHVKGLPFPAHMAQTKKSQALMYAVNPFGADHMSCEHDWFMSAPIDAAKQLGLTDIRPNTALDAAKAKMVAYTQMFYSLIDSLVLCAFCWGPDALYTYRDLEDFMKAATGWNMTLWELMKVGERRINMMRMFNAREGILAEADALPERMFVPLPDRDGAPCVNKEDFESAKTSYYELMNWNAKTGVPTKAKLQELGLEFTL